MEPIEPTNENTQIDEQTKTASSVVYECMLEFGKHTLANQLPNPVDGLKTVHRRILWTLKDHTTSTKANNIVGEIMALHPHGDAAIHEAIARLAQPFNTFTPLVGWMGNCGTYDGDPPSQQRYVDVWGMEDTKFLFLDGNLETLDYVPSETGIGTEPVCFIPRIPTSLLTAVFGLSVGFSPLILPYSFSAVCRMTMDYLEAVAHGHDKHKWLSKHPERFIPDSRVPSLVRNSQEIRRNAANGVFENTIIYDGTMSITPSNIIIRTLPLGVSPSGLAGKLSNMANDSNHPFSKMISEVRNESSTYLVIRIVLKKNVSPFDILDDLKKTVRFTSKQTPRMLWSDSQRRLRELGVLDVIEEWYGARRRLIVAGIKRRQSELLDKLRLLTAQAIVSGHAKEVSNIIRESNDGDHAITNLRKKFTQLTYQQARSLCQLRLVQLTKLDRAQLEKERDKVKDELAALVEKSQRINEVLMEDVQEAEKRFNLPRKAKLPDFDGAIWVDGGMVQYKGDEERHELLLSFKSSQITLIKYPEGNCHRYLHKGEMELIDEETICIPKEDACIDMRVHKYKPTSTIVLNKKKVFRVNRLLVDEAEGSFVFVGSHFLGITSKGKVEYKETTSMPLRKGYPSQGVNTDWDQIVPLENSDDAILVHVTPKEPNKVRITRWNPSVKNLTPVLGKIRVIGHGRVGDELSVNVPDDIRVRNSVTHFDIKKDLLEKIRPGTCITVDLSKKNPTGYNAVPLKKGVHGVPYVDVSFLK